MAAAVAAYGNHFHNGFHFDDSHTVVNNVFIRDLRNLPRFFASSAAFSSLPSNRSYRPLLTTTLAFDYFLGGPDPFFFQLTNFALFVFQGVLLFLLLRQWLVEDAHRRWLALFGAALFGLHAANSETVNYVIARGEILSTLGVTAALYLHRAGPRARRWRLYLLPALLGILAKAQAAMFAPLLFLQVALLDAGLSFGELLRPRRFREVLRQTLPDFAACGLGLLFVVKMAPGWQSGGDSRFDYLLTQPSVMVHYFLTFLLPANLSADTDWKVITNPFDDRVFIGLAFVAGMIWLAWRCSRSHETRPAAFGILWFFVALLPTSVVPLAEVMNDHRLYFPIVGLILAACCAIGLLLRRSSPAVLRLSVAAGVLVLVAHAFGVHARNRVWKDDESLWLDATLKSPQNARGLMNYGLTRLGKRDYPGARQYFQRALALEPMYPTLYINLGALEAAQGNQPEAERDYRRALELDPRLSLAYTRYAGWLIGAARPGEAVPLLRKGIELAPADLDGRHLLLRALKALGRNAERAEAAREILRLDGADADALAALAAPSPQELADEHLNLSLAAYNAREYPKTIAEAEQAIALRPADAAAYNNKCAAYNALGDYAKAAEACRRALEIAPDFQLARNNLAVSLARLTAPSR